MSAMWWALIGTSVIAFALKFTGHSIPARWLSHPKIQAINLQIPIALLSALVAVQAFSNKSSLVVDHRALGLVVAIVALIFRAPFPVVVISAAVTSAAAVHFF